MKKIIFLVGPHAVGKMTVGQELEKISGLKLFHNHIAIEVVSPFFSYSTPEGRKLVKAIRQEFFQAFSGSDASGYIITAVWAFSKKEDRIGMDNIKKMFEEGGHETFWIELEASLEERLRRNRTENRLLHKPSKRNIVWSEENLLQVSKEYRLNSFEGEITYRNYLKIENSNLSAEKTAQLIWEFSTGEAIRK